MQLGSGNDTRANLVDTDFPDLCGYAAVRIPNQIGQDIGVE
jgi:hypothetical protein